MPSKKYHIDSSFEEQQQLKDLIPIRSAKGQLVKRAYVLWQPTEMESSNGKIAKLQRVIIPVEHHFVLKQ